MTELTPFFTPLGIAIVGASANPGKLGYGVARNLVNSGYSGAIHFVSHRAGNLFGRPVYPDLASLPDPVDLAVLIVPASGMAAALQACAGRDIHAAIIMSSGFREAGQEGAALEAEIVAIARQNGIRIIGPNCIGLLDTHLPLDTTFLPPPIPPKGDVAFISQSGAICAAIIDWARGQGFGFSRLISLGNQADVNETDMLAAVVEDENTRVLTLYIESVADGRKFIEEASRVTRRKPVVALKVGRFEAGQKAAASHTGALAGSDTAYEAAFRKAGIFRATTSEEMFDWASALASCPLPAGRDIAVLTNAGGPGVIAADALETNGLHLAKLSASTRQRLTELLPPAAGLNNPVDMLASASPADYAACLRLLLDDETVDGVLVILPPPPMYPAESVAGAVIPLIQSSRKPVLVALMGETLIQEAAERFRRARVPEYRFPERAAAAMAVLAERQEFLTTETTRHPENFNKNPAASVVNSSADELVAAYGIPTAPARLAQSASAAVQAAAELGFPLVMKIASPDILHKSDVGGVRLDIHSEQEIYLAYTEMMTRVTTAAPQAKIEGVLLQRMVPGGQEVIVGMARDPQFGPLMMFGSGGVEVEGLKDVAFALGPLDQAEASDMIRRTWAGRKLRGFRSLPPADEAAAADILVKLSHLAFDHPEIAEIEINPLRVLNQGAVAIDVRLK